MLLSFGSQAPELEVHHGVADAGSEGDRLAEACLTVAGADLEAAVGMDHVGNTDGGVVHNRVLEVDAALLWCRVPEEEDLGTWEGDLHPRDELAVQTDRKAGSVRLNGGRCTCHTRD